MESLVGNVEAHDGIPFWNLVFAQVEAGFKLDLRQLNRCPVDLLSSTRQEGFASLEITIRRASRLDVDSIEELIDPFVDQGKLLPRTIDELVELIPSAFVAELDERTVGFAALEVYSRKLAEIRSLCVAQDFQGKGIGKRLIQACVDLAVERNVYEVMAITSSEEIFQHCGFDFTLPGEKKALFLQTRDEP